LLNGGRLVLFPPELESLEQLVDVIDSPVQSFYPEIFGKALKADLVFNVTLSSIAQDIILRERLPAPRDVHPDLDEATTRLEIWTRVLDPVRPAAQIDRGLRRGDGTVDPGQFIDLGSMQMGDGQAFALSAESALGNPEAASASGVRVAKVLEAVDEGQWIIESVP
jgi:hypothetical protein